MCIYFVSWLESKNVTCEAYGPLFNISELYYFHSVVFESTGMRLRIDRNVRTN